MESLDGKTIIVAGGAGFIGSNFIEEILSTYKKVRVVNFDKLTYCGNLENLKTVANDPRYHFVKGDIADRRRLKEVLEKYAPDYFINFAAESHVDRSIHSGTEEFIRTNILGVTTILEVLRGYPNLKKYLQVSTDEVYGDFPVGSKEQFTENAPLKPSSPYASTKAAGDLICLAYHRTFQLPVVVTRCGNNYGPYQYPEKLIPFFIVRMLEGKTLPLYGDGENVRDWIYVKDHCRALLKVLLEGKVGEVYNIGAKNEKSNREIADLIIGYFRAPQSRIQFVTDRPGHDRRYAIDPSKIEQELGWQTTHSFKKAFVETIKWYSDNEKWLETVKKRVAELNPSLREKNSKIKKKKT
jgi:dTDP-glucose 4,6-dehydratase